MATAVDQQPRLARGDDGAAEVDAQNRTARAFADRRLDADDAGRPAVALLQTAGDDADHAGMPRRRGSEDEARRQARLHLGDGRRLDHLLDLAALVVIAIEPARQL